MKPAGEVLFLGIRNIGNQVHQKFSPEELLLFFFFFVNCIGGFFFLFCVWWGGGFLVSFSFLGGVNIGSYPLISDTV